MGTLAVRRQAVRLVFSLVATSIWGRAVGAQTTPLDDRINAVIQRPAFRHSMFGIKVATLDGDTALYSLNADKLFVPGSTTKLVTTGTALELLGGDYRFHTKVYRTGSIGRDGVVMGNLILVASGDPNLSHRIRGDSLLFVDEDHSYGSDASPISSPVIHWLRCARSRLKSRAGVSDGWRDGFGSTPACSTPTSENWGRE